MHTYTYIYTQIPAYIYAYMHACNQATIASNGVIAKADVIEYMHTCSHTYILTYIHTYVLVQKHTYIHTYNQATFASNGVIAKADVIEYAGNNEWDIIEVKSCAQSGYTGYLPDLAFTVAAARRAGVRVRDALMVTVNQEYRYGDPPLELFAVVDCTDQVLTESGLVIDVFEGTGEGSIERVLSITGGQIVPEAGPKPCCKNCPIFDQCVGKGLEHPIWELPRLSGKRFIEVNCPRSFVCARACVCVCVCVCVYGLSGKRLIHWAGLPVSFYIHVCVCVCVVCVCVYQCVCAYMHMGFSEIVGKEIN
jgi:hypothetical protein